MVKPLDQSLVDNLVADYCAGKTISQLVAEYGVGASTVSRKLKAAGVEARGLKRRDLPVEEICADYRAGESEMALAKTHGVSRNVIQRILREGSIERRTLGESLLMRYVGTTREERAAITRRANEATRGRPAVESRLEAAAITRQANPGEPSVHERTFAAWLDERQVPYIREQAVGRYNIDFGVGDVAVEILGGEWHTTRVKSVIHGQRTPRLLDSDWCVLFVWATTNYPLTASAADYLVALRDEVRRDPSLRGEYRVIRGDGELMSRGRREDYERTGIVPARDAQHLI